MAKKYKIEMNERIREHWISLMESGRYKEATGVPRYHTVFEAGEWRFAPTGLLIEAFQSEMREIDPRKALSERHDIDRLRRNRWVARYDGGALWILPWRVEQWAACVRSSGRVSSLVYKDYAEACALLRETVEDR